MDTLTILKTMRAVVADVDPRRFDMSRWFDHRRECGCVMGLSLQAQPKLAAAIEAKLHVRLLKGVALSISGRVLMPARDGDRVWAEIARVTGLTPIEAQYLFDANAYSINDLVGQHGKTEALRRLDKLILKYDFRDKMDRAERSLTAIEAPATE